MAIRVQNMPRKSAGEDPICSTTHVAPFWNSDDHQLSQTLNANLSLGGESLSPPNQELQRLDILLDCPSSSSSQSSTQSLRGVTAIRTSSQDQCVSSESGLVQIESYGKHVDGQLKSSYLMSNLELSMLPNPHPQPSQLEAFQSAGHIPYAYPNPYFSSYSAYGPQTMIQPQMMSLVPGRVPLPFDFSQDGPVYVNAKQYNGIMRRRQKRAKLDAENKLVKSRKPYLHESRHKHALNRVRGMGGRFLSTKKSNQSEAASGHPHQDREAGRARTNIHDALTGYMHSDMMFQQQGSRIVNSSSQMAASMSAGADFMRNGGGR